MKRNYFVLLVLCILVSSCAPLKQGKPTTTPAAITASPSPTATEIPPTQTSTASPTPTLVLPVSQLTPVPSSSTKISSENLENIQEVARFYGKINFAAKLTRDEKFLFILDPERLTKYDYETMKPLTSIPVTNSAEDLQISDDGTWMVIDNNTLLDLRNENEPKQYVLPEVLDFHPELFVLSPDGSSIAAQWYTCPNLCEHELRIISTKDFSVLHSEKGPTLQKVFSFSPDGKNFAVVDRTTIETAGGGTEGSGAVISIWTTSDFTKVLSIPVRFPFEVSSIAISPDNTLLAASQRDFIDIFDMANGQPKATIDSLCFSYQREIMFGPYNIPPVLLENSNCSSLTWVIVENTARPANNNAPDFSKIVFNNTGGYKAISYPQPMSDFSVYDWFHYMFLSNDLLAAQNRHSVDTYACYLDLTAGNFDCQHDTTESVNNQILGKDRILATDGKYYDYEVSSGKVEIFSAENKSQVFYSIPFQNYGFSLLALDPVNKIVVYEEALTPSVIKTVIQDMERNRVLAEYKGETFISSLVFSPNKNYAAFCRSIGYNTRLNKDKLIVFDLVGKKIVYNQTSSCGYAALALSQDGSQLAIQLPYLKNSTDRRNSGKLQIFNTQPPYDKQEVDVDAPQYAIAFSPDDSLLAVSCGERDVCFFEVATNSMIHQLEGHSQLISLAFSPDGSILSMYSNWGLNSLWAIPPFENRTK